MKKAQVLAAACLVFALACSGGSDATAPAGDANVNVTDDQFSPSSVTIKSGQKVAWTWKGASAHNVTLVAGGNSPTQSSGTYSHEFDAAGTFSYYCSIHGTPTSGMHGTVTVQQ
jgi:plastocyanin